MRIVIGDMITESNSGKVYLTLSPSAVNQDIVKLPYMRIKRPCFPFDPVEWSPQAAIYELI